jgi:hypothetical protein
MIIDELIEKIFIDSKIIPCLIFAAVAQLFMALPIVDVKPNPYINLAMKRLFLQACFLPQHLSPISVKRLIQAVGISLCYSCSPPLFMQHLPSGSLLN